MISRREFIVSCLAAAGCIGATPSQAASHKCAAVLSGPLWWCDPSQNMTWGTSGWRDELDQQSAIGFNLLWLCGVQHSLDSPEHLRALRNLMDLCARRKVRVILDTGGTGMWYGSLDLKNELEVCGGIIRKLGEQFGGHPAFFAWYVPHEIYMTWPGQPMHSYIQALYRGLVEKCKAAVDLPVTVSPFFILDREQVFGAFRYNEPEEYRAYWTKLIRRSGFDTVMLQDSGEHFSYVTNEMRRPFFDAMSSACAAAGARFWGNVETAEYVCESKEEFVRRYGKIHHSAAKGLPWRAVPIDRLRGKLDLAAEYSDEIVTWGYREYCRPALGEAARQWYTEYKGYRQAKR